MGSSAGSFISNPFGITSGTKETIFGKGPDRFTVDPGARPDAPKWGSLFKDNTTQLKDDFRMQNRPDISAGLDKRGMEQYRNEALAAPGTSVWEGLAKQNLATSQGQARSRLAEDAASQQATARNQLAMRGGISGGARERLAQQGNRDQLRAQQQLAQQGITEGGNIGLKAEEMRKQQLAGLPGMEIAQLAPQFQDRQNQLNIDQFNIQNALNEKAAKDKFDMGQYMMQMQQWAAANQANAMTAPTGNQGGLLGGLGK